MTSLSNVKSVAQQICHLDRVERSAVLPPGHPYGFVANEQYPIQVCISEPFGRYQFYAWTCWTSARTRRTVAATRLSISLASFTSLRVSPESPGWVLSKCKVKVIA